jgi:hypothetical protein
VDLKMASSSSSSIAFPTWDFAVEGGIVPYVSGNAEGLQQAQLAAFLQRGLLTQYPDIGVDWLSFFTSKISFGVLDSQIRSALLTAGVVYYAPNYYIDNDQLVCQLERTI